MHHNGVHAFMAAFFTTDGRPSRGQQKDIASFVGVSSATVSRWFKGSTTIDPKHWKLLAQCAGTDVATLRSYVEGDQAGTTEMLSELLSEIRAHRASDIAPSARLVNMPTRDELRAEIHAEVQAATRVWFNRANENTLKVTEAVAALTSAVEELEKRLPVPEAPPPAPVGRPARRIGNPASRTSRSESMPRKRP